MLASLAAVSVSVYQWMPVRVSSARLKLGAFPALRRSDTTTSRSRCPRAGRYGQSPSIASVQRSSAGDLKPTPRVSIQSTTWSRCCRPAGCVPAAIAATPPRRLTQSSVYALLSNQFYAGKIVYKGKVYKGRHKEIISEELFDRVQAILKAHNKSGERDRQHQHHLKGTIFCDNCGHRLVYSRNKGNGGTYEYFVCPYKQRGECSNGYHRADVVEAKIEEHYKTLTLTPREHDRVVDEVERRVTKLADTSEQELSWAASELCRQVWLILRPSFGHGRRCLGGCVLG